MKIILKSWEKYFIINTEQSVHYMIMTSFQINAFTPNSTPYHLLTDKMLNHDDHGKISYNLIVHISFIRLQKYSKLNLLEWHSMKYRKKNLVPFDFFLFAIPIINKNSSGTIQPSKFVWQKNICNFVNKKWFKETVYGL